MPSAAEKGSVAWGSFSPLLINDGCRKMPPPCSNADARGTTAESPHIIWEALRLLRQPFSLKDAIIFS